MSYLIKDTTKEERMEIVKKALAISLTGADKPSDKVLELANQYIEGIKELQEIKQELLKEYTQNER